MVRMTPEQETASRLISELDEFASRIRKSTPKVAKKVDAAMYSVMEVEIELAVAAHQQGRPVERTA